MQIKFPDESGERMVDILFFMLTPKPASTIRPTESKFITAPGA